MTCNSTDISKKTWRKLMILIIVMLAVICVRLNAKPAYAAEEVESGTCGENLTWVLDNEGILIISGEGDMSSWAPSKVPWKNYQNKIKNVIIDAGVTSIGSYTFSGCSSLTSITIPEGVTSIGSYTFSGCSSLTSITIPEGVTSIGNEAFSDCSSLTSITIPKGVTSIGDGAFRECSNLTSIMIHEGVTSIGSYLFNGCSSLTSITIPAGVTSIGSYVFDGCSSLTSITIPEGVTSIGYSAFYNCSSLTSITIPEGVTSIGSYTFYGCSTLTSITIPEGVTSIGNSAFYNCSSLTSITIPEGVTSIGSYTFYGCSTLTSITIPAGVTSIGNEAFYNCSSLTSITIPEGVTSIGSYTFSGCSSLTSITIPEGVTSIESNTFVGCSSLTSITIPEGVTSIGSYTFYGCSSLTSIAIPDSVTDINYNAFYDIADNYIAYVFPGSYADRYFSSNHKRYLYTEDTDSQKYISFRYDSVVIKPGDIMNVSGLYDTNIASDYITFTIEDDSLFMYDDGKIAELDEGETYLVLSAGEVIERIKLICTSETADITDISMKDDVLDLKKGERITEQITFAPDNAVGKEVTWSSSDTSVVTVEGGCIEAVGSGTATVTAALTDDPTIFDTCEVTVVNSLKAIVTFDESFYKIVKGNTQKIGYYIYPYDAVVSINYESSDPDMISIDENGYMTAHKNGTADITISSGDISKTVTLTVYTPLKGISLDKSSAQLNCEEQIQLNVIFDPEDTTEREIIWTSSNGSVIKADENGLVTPMGKGIATITATAGNHTAICNIVSKWHTEEILAAVAPTYHDYHEVDGTAVAATCTTAGKHADQKCSRCNVVIEGETIAALGHDWSNWTVVKEATEDEEGLEVRTCCRDATHTEERAIPKLDHTHDLVYTNAVSATCTVDGNLEYWTCSKCGRIYSDPEGTAEIDKEDTVIKAKGHTEEVLAAVSPTCTETGLTEGKRIQLSRQRVTQKKFLQQCHQPAQRQDSQKARSVRSAERFL